MVESSSVRSLAERIAEYSNEETSPLIELSPGNPNKPPVIFVCGSIGYVDLARALDIDNPVLALTLDDWLDVFSGNSDTQYINTSSNYDRLVDRYYQAICHYDRLDECVLCGFSFAGLVALGLAERLESAGKSVASVALIDTHAPDYFDHASLFNRAAKKLVDTENRLTSLVVQMFGADKLFKHALFKNIYTKRLQLARLEACKAMRIPGLSTQITLFRAVKRSFYDPKKMDLG
jgi:thioesterase domain-containing protein